MPSTPTKSWERGAKLVKNTDQSNQYLEHIRQTHDPAMHVKTIEDELKGTMGKALGKQGEKILRFVRAMAQERKRYDELLRDDTKNARSPSEEMKNVVKRYNDMRREAMQARWELLVHRQAVGFIVDNHNTVAKSFPIGEPLRLQEDDEASGEEEGEENGNGASNGKGQAQKKFGTQTDWWQRIGRWR